MQPHDFQLCLEIDLIIQLCPDAVFFGLTVGADQYKNREEDRLQRNNHGQQAKREWVECMASSQGVDRCPAQKPYDVHEQKDLARTQGGDFVRYPIPQRPVFSDFLGELVGVPYVPELLDRFALATCQHLNRMNGGRRMCTDEIKELFAGKVKEL